MCRFRVPTTWKTTLITLFLKDVITPPQANGVYIKYIGGKYSNSDILWNGQTVVGIALKTSSSSFCIHPEQSNGIWSSTNTSISGVGTYGSASAKPTSYLTGKADTDAIIASGYAGSAVTFARNAVYADGSVGYLPAFGQFSLIMSNISAINSALALINGTAIINSAGNSNGYWTSTQYNASMSWRWCRDDNGWPYGKSDSFYVRSVTDF